jgi:hypothetical protein
MNTAKTTERAIALVIQQYADLITGVSVRPFQCLAEDSFRPTDLSGGTRSYPQIDIRCSTPTVNPSQHTESVTCTVTIATNEDDDQDHADLSQLYEAVESVLQALFDQAKTTDGAELTLLKSVYTDAHGSNFYFGGMTFEGGNPPFDDEGIATISQSVVIHYSRR